MTPRTVCVGVLKQTLSSNWGRKQEEAQSHKTLSSEICGPSFIRGLINKLSNHLTLKVFEVKKSLCLFDAGCPNNGRLHWDGGGQLKVT